MTPLPVVSCDACGACCTIVGAPPGAYLYLAQLPTRPDLWPEWVVGSPDVPRWQRAPEAARAAVRAYDPAGTPGGKPCVWLDLETRRCRWYEHRPEVCRTFEMGGRDCLKMRHDAGVTT